MIHSSIMVPGDNEKMLNKIGTLGAGLYVINLEDAVSDVNKLKARFLVKEKIRYLDERINYCVRVNALNDGGVDDILELNEVETKCFRIPKVKTIDDVETALDLAHKKSKIHLTIETKEAFENFRTFKKNSRVETVFLGLLDLFESLRMSQHLITMTNPTVQYIMSKFLIDAKLAGFNFFSHVFQEHQNLTLFREWCEFEKAMGYTAKGCITPSQVAIANEVFATKEGVLIKARYIIERFETYQRMGITGFVDAEYGFIDEPIYKDALLVLKNFQ